MGDSVFVVLEPDLKAVAVEDMTLEQARQAVRVLARELECTRNRVQDVLATWRFCRELRQ